MKLAIMQPYFFPYLGYFQLMSKVDKFVFYDDVPYTKGGWINRNRILDAGEAAFITLPVKRAPIGTRIDAMIVDSAQARFLRKLRARIATAYQGAPYVEQGLDLFDRALSAGPSLAAVAKASVKLSAEALGIRSEIVESSAGYGNQYLTGVSRVVDICRRERTKTYVNAPGGRHLYRPDRFAKEGMALEFLSPEFATYPQQSQSFVPGLSVLDAIMNVGPDATGDLARGGSCRP